jgi:addiction module toxin, RelE/StbE family
MSFNVTYHQDVKDIDLPKINKDIKLRIKKAIEERLMTDPLKYGKPLRKSLKGYWKLRVVDYRVVYKIEESNIIVLAIIHRKEVYNDVKSRL